jgi:transposase
VNVNQFIGDKEMITVEDKEIIRRAYYIEHKSIRQIQRETGYHRKTIRKALDDGMVPEYNEKEPRPTPALTPVKSIIDHWLAEDEKQSPKQRHTAKRMYERLKAEYGFSGAESTIRKYVGQVRRQLRNEVFIPLSFAPGQLAQIDFGEAAVCISREQLIAQLFCLRMGYSKQTFVMALPSQSQESFFLGHVRAFAFLGGVPRQLVYDNLKTAVKTILEGHNRKEQSAFTAFRSHYLFESRFCNVRQAHEKGLVEGLVGYARRNWLVPIPEYNSWDELNEALWEKCLAEGTRQLRGMEMTIGQAMAAEKPHMLPLPSERAYESKWLKAYPDRVEITNGHQMLAVHPRCYGKHQDILNPLHYLSLLEQRPGAYEHAKPIHQWQQRWPDVYDRYFAALREHLPGDQSTREFIRILRLHEHYPEQAIASAMEESLLCHCYSSDGFRQLVMRLTEPSIPPALPGLTGELATQSVEWPDLVDYDRLLWGGRKQ